MIGLFYSMQVLYYWTFTLQNILYRIVKTFGGKEVCPLLNNVMENTLVIKTF